MGKRDETITIGLRYLEYVIIPYVIDYLIHRWASNRHV